MRCGGQSGAAELVVFQGGAKDSIVLSGGVCGGVVVAWAKTAGLIVTREFASVKRRCVALRTGARPFPG